MKEGAGVGQRATGCGGLEQGQAGEGEGENQGQNNCNSVNNTK